MEHAFLRGLAIVSLSSLLFIQIAQATVTEETQDPYTDDPSIQITLSGELSLGNAVLQWTKYEGGDLKWYKVVHSQSNAAPYYPNDGFIQVYSDPDTINYTHENVLTGTNYYRVCVITNDDRRGCSNTVTINNGTGEAIFADTENHWAKPYVKELYNDGVVVGRDGNFEPDEPVLRSEAIKIILLALSFEPAACDATIFLDLEATDWFCGVVTKAYILDFIEGVNGNLLPLKNITRAEAAKILLKAKGFEAPTVENPPFSDVDPSAWYAGWVYKASVLGYVEGSNGNFEPDREISRAELAKIVVLASN